MSFQVKNKGLHLFKFNYLHQRRAFDDVFLRMFYGGREKLQRSSRDFKTVNLNGKEKVTERKSSSEISSPFFCTFFLFSQRFFSNISSKVSNIPEFFQFSNY